MSGRDNRKAAVTRRGTRGSGPRTRYQASKSAEEYSSRRNSECCDNCGDQGQLDTDCYCSLCGHTNEAGGNSVG